MAKHEFGIMEKAPVAGERYDSYRPQEYSLIPVDDCYIEPLLTELQGIDFFWHSLDVPSKGLAYCGTTLIAPESMGAVIRLIEAIPELHGLRQMLSDAKARGKFVIHYGL